MSGLWSFSTVTFSNHFGKLNTAIRVENVCKAVYGSLSPKFLTKLHLWQGSIGLRIPLMLSGNLTHIGYSIGKLRPIAKNNFRFGTWQENNVVLLWAFWNFCTFQQSAHFREITGVCCVIVVLLWSSSGLQYFVWGNVERTIL